MIRVARNRLNNETLNQSIKKENSKAKNILGEVSERSILNKDPYSSKLNKNGINIMKSVNAYKQIFPKKEIDTLFNSPSKLCFINNSSLKKPFLKIYDSPINQMANRNIFKKMNNQLKGIETSLNDYSLMATRDNNKSEVMNTSIHCDDLDLFHKVHKFVSVDEECLTTHIILFEKWIEIMRSNDNPSSLDNILSYYLKENEISFIYNKILYELFYNNSINKQYVNLLKLALIVITIIKFLILDNNYETFLRTEMNKIISRISETFAFFFEMFVLPKISRQFKSKNNYLFDIIHKLRRTNYLKNLKTIKVHEVILFIEKDVDNLISVVKSFSHTSLNHDLIQPLHNILNDLLSQINEIEFIEFNKLIYDNVLYCLIKRQEKSYKNYDINFKKEMQISNRSPYLPEIDLMYEYTLVLDLDETLLHFFFTSTVGMFVVRPGCIEFLKELANKYEIIIFTAGTKEYADSIINLIDANYELIKYRLYRHHTSFYHQNSIKELSKIIIIDNIPENFKNEPNNGFSIKTWKDDINDKELYYLMKILLFIYNKRIQNVTDIIKTINKLKYNENFSYSTIDLNSL